MKGFHHGQELKIRYIKLSVKEKGKLLKNLKSRLRSNSEIMFAYVHGSFIEREFSGMWT